MRADYYNQDQIEAGSIGGPEITELAKLWQERHGLVVDGMCGPKTLATMQHDAGESSNLGLAALEIAISLIGCGEDGGTNNSGDFVALLHKSPAQDTKQDLGAWCASFCSHVIEQACQELGAEMPFKRSGSAKVLFRNAEKVGTRTSSPTPGDLVLWDRGKKGDWMGHIGIIEKSERGIIHTVEGNVGRYPSLVRRFVHDCDREGRLIGFCRLPSV